ncbi:MAG: phytoene desaturase [Chthonomonadales bacterium]|nr:phytoene desaturase [Chthonomonadales bacterium]
MENRMSVQRNADFAAVTETTAPLSSRNGEGPAYRDLSRHRRDHRPHAVVIGAGLGGLSAAIHLARDGWRVSVFEKNARCGGRMNMIEEEGFRIDMGPTLLMMPEVIQGIFEACGRDMKDYLDLRRLDPAYRVRFADGSHLEMCGSVEAMQAEAERLSPSDSGNIPKMCAAMQRQYENARFNFIEKPFNGAASLMRPQTLQGLAKALPLTSVYNFVARYVQDERLRQAFTFQTLYLGISPFDCPSIYALLPYIEMEFGVWYPMGGMMSVADALVRLLREMGGEIHTETSVNRIVTEGRRARGVQVDCLHGVPNGFVEADVVVANVDAPTAYSRLVPPALRRKHSDSRLATKEYGCSAHLLYLGVRDLEADFKHHEVLLSADYQETLSAITKRKVIPEDPALYVCIPTRTDPSLAPPGHDVVYVLTPCPHLGGTVDWEVEGDRLRERVIDKLEGAGLPGLRQKIVFERQFTPQDFESQYGCYQGSAFGLSPRFFQSSYFRPQMRSEEVDGLYFAGAGTHPGGGVPIVLTSGRLAAETIAADRKAVGRRASAW